MGPLTLNNLKASRSAKGVSNRRNLLGMNFLKEFALHFLFNESRVVILSRVEAGEMKDLHDLFMEGNHPYIDIEVGNGVSAKGAWDTGAGMTLFDSSFIKKHPALFEQVGRSSGTDSSGTSHDTPMYRIKAFIIAGKRFQSVRVASVDLSVANSTIQTPMDFILGYNVLSQVNWIFDFPRKKWKIAKMLF